MTDTRRCQWCGHDLRRWAHSPVTIGSAARMVRGLGRQCEQCSTCAMENVDGTHAIPHVTDPPRPAWVRRAMGEGSGDLPPKVYR